MSIRKYSKKIPPVQTHIRADRDEWFEFLGTNPDEKCLAFIGISRSTWSKISAGKSPLVSVASYRLASFTRYGHLADIAGSAWRDFYVSGDTLLLPGMREPFTAPQLRSAWVDLDQLPRLRFEIEQLRRDTDMVEISPPVHAWLLRLGQRPFAIYDR